MNGTEIFNEILKSPRLKKLLGVPESTDLQQNANGASEHKEITIIRNIIEGQIRNTTEDSIFKNITKLYDL